MKKLPALMLLTAMVSAGSAFAADPHAGAIQLGPDRPQLRLSVVRDRAVQLRLFLETFVGLKLQAVHGTDKLTLTSETRAG